MAALARAPRLTRLRRSLFWRGALASGALFSTAGLLVALTPVTVSSPVEADEALVLAVGTLAVVGLNFLILKRTFKPLERLAEHMGAVDPLRPGQRAPRSETSREIDRIAACFNEMVERLENERRDAARRALRAEDAERRRIARELHDDIGQRLTLLLLELSQVQRDAPTSAALAQAQATARELLNEVRQIATRLRPESLDDLGLSSALLTLGDRVAQAAELEIRSDIEHELPAMAADAEAVVLRVAQEGLTNVVRHARASAATMSLAHADGYLRLVVSDDGCGHEGRADGGGIRGMRERALSIGGRVELSRSAAGGTELVLQLPDGGGR